MTGLMVFFVVLLIIGIIMIMVAITNPDSDIIFALGIIIGVVFTVGSIAGLIFSTQTYVKNEVKQYLVISEDLNMTVDKQSGNIQYTIIDSTHSDLLNYLNDK